VAGVAGDSAPGAFELEQALYRSLVVADAGCVRVT